jgi:hypothetical protein
MILLIAGTTLAGKYSASSGSHLGHELAAALAWAGVDKARIKARAMMRFRSFQLL